MLLSTKNSTWLWLVNKCHFMLQPYTSSTCTCCRRLANERRIQVRIVVVMCNGNIQPKTKAHCSPSVPSQRSPSPTLNLASKLVSSPTQPRSLAGWLELTRLALLRPDIFLSALCALFTLQRQRVFSFNCRYVRNLCERQESTRCV